MVKQDTYTENRGFGIGMAFRKMIPYNVHNSNFIFVDKLTKEQRKKNMQAVKATGSKIETALAKALFARGHRYRKNNKSVFGKPDLTFKKLKIAVFVDSEFWHGKDWQTRKYDHKSNQAFWLAKIEKNIKRDKEVNLQLLTDGWIIVRFWGSDIQKNLQTCITKIEQKINEAKRKISFDKFEDISLQSLRQRNTTILCQEITGHEHKQLLH